jgi:hypothetical protein
MNEKLKFKKYGLPIFFIVFQKIIIIYIFTECLYQFNIDGIVFKKKKKILSYL